MATQIYKNISPASKRLIKAELLKIKALTCEQKQHAINLFISPYDLRISTIERFLKNEISKEQLLYTLNKIDKRLKEIWEFEYGTKTIKL